MNKKAVSTSTLKELYEKTTHGVSIGDAAKTLGLSYGQALSCKKKLVHYISMISNENVALQKRLRKNYVIAAKWAIAQDSLVVRKIEAPVPELPAVRPIDPSHTIDTMPDSRQPTHYDKLNLSFEVFKDSIHAFIEAEVQKRVGDIKAENERMKKMIDEARLGNFADALKQKWEGQQ